MCTSLSPLPLPLTPCAQTSIRWEQRSQDAGQDGMARGTRSGERQHWCCWTGGWSVNSIFCNRSQCSGYAPLMYEWHTSSWWLMLYTRLGRYSYHSPSYFIEGVHFRNRVPCPAVVCSWYSTSNFPPTILHSPVILTVPTQTVTMVILYPALRTPLVQLSKPNRAKSDPEI